MSYGYCPQLSYTNESVHNMWYCQIYLGDYFSLMKLVSCIVIYSLKIFIFFNIGNHLKCVIWLTFYADVDFGIGFHHENIPI